MNVHDVRTRRAGLDQVAESLEHGIRVVSLQVIAQIVAERFERDSSVPPSALAPAASVGPSVPSVPALATRTSGKPSIAMAAARANS